MENSGKICLRGGINMDKKDVLLVAINDIQDSIRFLDTKITFLLGVVGIIFSALVGCKSNLFIVYNNLKQNNIEFYIFVFTIFIYLISTGLIFLFAIKCILPRHDKKSQNYNIWYIDKNINFNDYNKSIINLKEDKILDLLSHELYNVNMINARKFCEVERTFKSFAVSCSSLAVLVLYIVKYYL